MLLIVLFSKSCLARTPDSTRFKLKVALEWKALSLASGPRAISHQPENPQGTGLVSTITSMIEGHSLSRGKKGAAELEKFPFTRQRSPVGP